MSIEQPPVPNEYQPYLRAALDHAVGLPSPPVAIAAPVGAELRRFAHRERILAPLAFAARAGVLVLDDESGQELESAYADVARMSLRLEHSQLETIELLRANEIEAYSIKGLAVARFVYVSPEARQSSDIDILVEPAQFAAANRVLGDSGCRALLPPRSSTVDEIIKANTYRDRAGIEIDLHQAIDWGRNALTSRLVDNPLQTELGGVVVRSPRVEGLFLQACVASEVGTSRLSSLFDVAAMARSDDLDWDLTVELALRHRLATICARATARAALVFGLDAELSCRAESFPPSVASRLVGELTMRPSPGWGIGYAISTQPVWHWPRHLRTMAMPDRAYREAVGSPGPLGFLRRLASRGSDYARKRAR
ncbi:MAG: nucleotidyltransferase family protein [Actinomycetia bacterium]|nr:nucleotidyltransferase family protein [Actinomycetes bacterium]